MEKPLRLGVAGLGVVGTSLIQLLRRRRAEFVARAGRECVLMAYSVRHRRDAAAGLGQGQFFENAAAMAASADIDVFVELIGGADGAAFEAVKAALARGLPVVTANKAMLAAHGLQLANLSESHKAPLYYEAAVGGGIPVVKTLRESLGGKHDPARRRHSQRHLQLYSVAHGDREADVRRLPRRGAAARLRRGGSDLRHRRFRHRPQARDPCLARFRLQDRRGGGVGRRHRIRSRSPTLRRPTNSASAIKLLGVAERTPHGVEQRVHPTMVSKSAPLAQTMGVLNAVSIDGDAVGELTLVGPGAGGDATASAVASDIADIARGTRLPTFGRPAATLVDADRVPMQRHEGGYYVRLAVADRPGAMGAIAARFGERMISLEAIMQKRAAKEAAASGVVPVVLMTHGTTEASIRDALAHAVEDGVVREKPQVIRIEREAF